MEGHGVQHASIGELLYPVINFALFAFVLVRGLRGPIREFFRSRGERLREEITAGDRARREAEAVHAQLTADIADLPAARARLRQALLAVGERERDHVLAQARITADRLRADAAVLAEQEVAAARRALREEAVVAAIDRAAVRIREAADPADQARFVREFTTGIAS